jgi:hypothetical protein
MSTAPILPVPVEAPAADGSAAAKLALLGLGAVAVGSLTGCLSSQADGEAAAPAPPALPANFITSLTLRESGGGAVTVNSIAGGATGVRFPLDGGTAPTSRPADPGATGAARSYSFTASGTGGSTTLGITINPTPNDGLPQQPRRDPRFSRLDRPAAFVG